jgi:hypothetical protein
MSVMLIWPLLVAGVFALPNIRPKVSSLFDAFKSDYCEDLVTAVSGSESPDDGTMVELVCAQGTDSS